MSFPSTTGAFNGYAVNASAVNDGTYRQDITGQVSVAPQAAAVLQFDKSYTWTITGSVTVQTQSSASALIYADIHTIAGAVTTIPAPSASLEFADVNSINGNAVVSAEIAAETTKITDTDGSVAVAISIQSSVVFVDAGRLTGDVTVSVVPSSGLTTSFKYAIDGSVPTGILVSGNPIFWNFERIDPTNQIISGVIGSTQTLPVSGTIVPMTEDVTGGISGTELSVDFSGITETTSSPRGGYVSSSA